MSQEQFANLAQTTLSGSINSSATSLTVASATGFPASAQYRVTIDTEIMLVTAGAGTTTWTVTRGVEGTNAASHLSGATVGITLTAGALDKRLADDVDANTMANRAASAKAGRLFFPSDQAGHCRDNGATWDWYGSGPKYSPPALSGLTRLNALVGDVVTQNGNDGPVSVLIGNVALGNLTGYLKNVPGSTYTIDCVCSLTGRDDAGSTECGILLSDGTKLWDFGIDINTYKTFANRYNSVSSFNAAEAGITPYRFSPTQPVWLRLVEDGTHRTLYVSLDGVTFVKMAFVNTGTWLTPTQYGFFWICNSNSQGGATFYHFTP